MADKQTRTRFADTNRVGPSAGEEDQPYRMLIVDDDPEVGTALESFFEEFGYEIKRAGDGEEALALMQAEEPIFDIVLLDVMLPKLNGFEVLRRSQEMGLVSPVLMISGRGEQEAKLQGFGLGAADYVTKPFEPDELAARVRAILGRSQPPAEAPMEVYEFGDVEVNFSTYKVYRGDQPVELTEVEFDILQYLLQNRGQTVSRKRLLREALTIDEEVVTFTVDQDTLARTLDRHIEGIRTKIEPNPYEPTFLETVYGQGYRFNG